MSGNLMENPDEILSKQEELTVFNELNGCVKAEKDIDVREEYLEYLDERYEE